MDCPKCDGKIIEKKPKEARFSMVAAITLNVILLLGINQLVKNVLLVEGFLLLKKMDFIV